MLVTNSKSGRAFAIPVRDILSIMLPCDLGVIENHYALCRLWSAQSYLGVLRPLLKIQSTLASFSTATCTERHFLQWLSCLEVGCAPCDSWLYFLQRRSESLLWSETGGPAIAMAAKYETKGNFSKKKPCWLVLRNSLFVLEHIAFWILQNFEEEKTSRYDHKLLLSP